MQKKQWKKLLQKKKKAPAKKAAPKAKKEVAKKPAAKKAPAKKTEEKKVEVPASDKKDDLKVIKGIGPKLEEALNKIGFTAYEQMAKLTIKDLTKILADNGINTKLYDISGWKKQAKSLLKEVVAK